jgi:hypothetical protein
MTMTYDEIKEAVAELDPYLDADDPSFHVAALLIASLVVGTDPFMLAVFTGEHIEWIMQIGARWQASGIWTDEGVSGDWFSEHGGLEFWLDVNVGHGVLVRTPEGYVEP